MTVTARLGMHRAILAGLFPRRRTVAISRDDSAGANHGEHVIDLEGLANHRGSAFGARGEQPRHRRFQSRITAALRRPASTERVWIEHEEPFIGSVGLPPDLVAAMAAAPRFVLMRPRAERIRIVAAYASRSREAVLSDIERVAARAGAACAGAERERVLEERLDLAVDSPLDYYDAAYERGWQRTGALSAAESFAMPCSPADLIAAVGELPRAQ